MALLKSLFWNRREHRLRAAWRLLLFTLILVVLLGVVAGGLLGATGGLAATLLFALAALLAAWLAARFLDRRPFAALGFHFNKAWWLNLGFGMALGALLMAIIFLIEWAAGWISVTGLFRTAAPGISFAEAILRPLLLFIFVGIVEEVIFRGYLLQNLAEAFNLPSVGPRAAMPAAWLLSSILFGLAHAGNPFASPTSTLYLMIAGLFLGLGYILTGELAIPIGLHITWNFFQGNVFGFPVSGNPTSGTTVIAIEQGGPVIWTGGRFGPEAGLLGVLANLVGMVLILLWLRARRGHVSLYLPLALPPVDVERPAG